MLSITTETDGSVSMTGRLDAAQTDAAAKQLRELQGTVTVNLAGLEYISSAGLGLFIGLHQRLSAAGGSLTLVGMSDHVRHIFRLVRLDKVLNIQ
jgi:anti-sigma B factor antagonist